MSNFYTLGIETSFDDSCVSVLNHKQVLSNVILSHQFDEYGGVIPELAGRKHSKLINHAYMKALTIANILSNDIDLIAYTVSPGLPSSLCVGINFAKGLSMSLNKPSIPINHLQGHAFSPMIDTNISMPFISVIITGGHTQINIVNNFYEEPVLYSQTIDDACGEAIDKVARMLGLGFPGGKQLEDLSKLSKNPYHFNIPMIGRKDFSFSGLKHTASVAYKKGVLIEDIARGFQNVIFESIVEKINMAINETMIDRVAVVGGVSSNMFLRELISKKVQFCKIYYPSMEYCQDNGAMIGFLGYIINNKK